MVEHVSAIFYPSPHLPITFFYAFFPGLLAKNALNFFPLPPSFSHWLGELGFATFSQDTLCKLWDNFFVPNLSNS